MIKFDVMNVLTIVFKSLSVKFEVGGTKDENDSLGILMSKRDTCQAGSRS